MKANEKHADLVLIAGDMFHENKPSRRTLHSTFDIVQRHVLGEKDVFIEILNDQTHTFRAGHGQVNFYNPYHAISLPIFAIHGNHDDPSRDGGAESLAALDLLSVSKYVNYFGKADAVDEIEIQPILIRKMTTTGIINSYNRHIC